MTEEKCEKCKKDPCECEMSVEDLANYADDKVDALIDLLIKKGVITEDEYAKTYEDLFEDDDEDDSEEKSEEKKK